MADIDIPPYPLYHNTYHLYRLSPLHHGDAPLLANNDPHAAPSALRLHARRLQEQLKGDRVRGVQVDFASAVDTASLGPLRHCAWDPLGDDDAWIDRHRPPPRADALQPSPSPSRAAANGARGIHVSLDYERHSYNALLLRDPAAPVSTTASPQSFTSLPLLLIRMPAPVRAVFLDYLRTVFDAHVAPLKLTSPFLSSCLETYLRHLASPSSTQSIPDTIRTLQIQLAFPTATTILKHIEITIPGAHVAGFVSRGSRMDKTNGKPFTTAFSHYLKHHMALDISHPQVEIAKISCSSFHVSTDRLKLLAPGTLADTSFEDEGAASQDASAGQIAVLELYRSLVREAAGTGMFLPDGLASGTADDSSTSTPTAKTVRRKRVVSSASMENNKQKKFK